MEYFKNISYMNSHIFLLLFFYLFTVHRFSKKKTIGICICAFLLFNLSDCLKLNLYPDSDLCYFLVTIFQILVAQLTNLLISSTRDSRVLFVGLSASNYVIAGSILATVIYILTNDGVMALAGSTLVHILILIFIYIKINRIWIKCFEKEYIKNWWELCLIPVFFYCGFSFLAFFPYRLEDNPNNISGVLIFIVTMFVSYVVVLRYVESESKRSDIYWRNVLSECYIKDLENQYHSVEQFEQNLKILRHDIRHYSGMIEHLLDQKEYGEVRNLVKHINDVVDENKIVKYCNHLLMNTILFNMMEKARSLDIYVNLDTVIGKSIPVDEYEFAAVLANLFENALMCVQDLKKEKRYVDAKIQCTEECLLIDIKNECEKEVVMDSFTGLPKSSKGKNHGLGMLSISAFADKIGGNIGCYCENGIFQIIIFAKF
jgi:hypothetical protein